MKATDIDVTKLTTSELVDHLSSLREMQETVLEPIIIKIKEIEANLLQRGLTQLRDKSIKSITFRGNHASVLISLAQKLDILNIEVLKTSIPEKWHGEIKEKKPDHTIAADFKRALINLYTDDYEDSMTIGEVLKGISIIDNKETKVLEISAQTLLLKKLKGDYEKDKELFSLHLATPINENLDEELHYISKIKNYERIQKYFTNEEIKEIKNQIQKSIYITETPRLTLK